MQEKPPIISGFTYIRPLGPGGFANVYLYEQQMPHRQVAIKVLKSEFIDSKVINMFNTEADVMAQLGAHPNIITVYEAGISTDGHPYIAMEPCRETLTNRMEEYQLSVEEVLNVGIKLCDALQTAHNAGVLHRDIKPSNLMYNQFDALVLTDFGIAVALQDSSVATAMSVRWAAPEVVNQETKGTISSEIWSVGVTLYSLLAGENPFEKDKHGNTVSSLELIKRVSKGTYQKFERTDIPPELVSTLKKTLSLSPRNRQTSIFELATELQQIQESLGLAVTPIVSNGNTNSYDLSQAPQSVQIQYGDENRGPARAEVTTEKTLKRKRLKANTQSSSSRVESLAVEKAQKSVRQIATICTILGIIILFLIAFLLFA